MKKEYLKEGKFKLSKELIDKIPCISSISHSTYAINKNGFIFFNFKLKIFFSKNKNLKKNKIGKIICWGEDSSNEKPVEGLENETIVAISPNHKTCLFVTIDNKIFYNSLK